MLLDVTSKYQLLFQITTASGERLSFGILKMGSVYAQLIFEPFSKAVADLCDVINNKDSTETTSRQLRIPCLIWAE